MHKEIEKVVSRINQAMEKNRKAYREAEENYRDTGYDRYYNKMRKLDSEYEELESFLHPEKKVEDQTQATRELDDLKMKFKSMKSKWEYLRCDLPASAEVIGIDDLFRDIQLN